jgi:hypothetical protein
MPTSVKYRKAPTAWEFQSNASETSVSRLFAITRDPDLLAIALFVLVGLLISSFLIRFLPLPLDVAAYLAQAG